jgi:hypothetical protein
LGSWCWHWNCFGVTCFWKAEVDFGIWSWVLGYFEFDYELWFKVLEFESWVFFLAWFTLCMSLLGLETIFEIKITIWNFGVVWKFELTISSHFWTWSIKLGLGCQR